MAALIRDWACGCRIVVSLEEGIDERHACPEADALLAQEEEAIWLASMTGEPEDQRRARELGERVREHFRKYGPPVEERR
ncbi:MAG: hypothetical protein K6V36_17020 [Anaerolineae bacterium]|uniref:hypothetical protein n=1 Tax=Rubrobacter calidifluminis TaxID=1392640 RepID=UPI0023612507|nr:hypothetical protein [Rubrobacter calidifluminis]MCL6432537.1 hypothetical protein [Anaerolineae bacterium]